MSSWCYLAQIPQRPPMYIHHHNRLPPVHQWLGLLLLRWIWEHRKIWQWRRRPAVTSRTRCSKKSTTKMYEMYDYLWFWKGNICCSRFPEWHIGQWYSGNFLKQAFTIHIFHHHRHIFQNLLLNSICAVKLEYNVFVEYMLDTCNLYKCVVNGSTFMISTKQNLPCTLFLLLSAQSLQNSGCSRTINDNFMEKKGNAKWCLLYLQIKYLENWTIFSKLWHAKNHILSLIYFLVKWLREGWYVLRWSSLCRSNPFVHQCGWF